ncbi:hypothetical protein Q2295_08160 [Leptospira interrogans]|nr:hypothetical protein [Leptospira interrogans]OQN93141.1 hypothetical protein AR690_10280 [Leptospira interrogans serovar Lai]EJO76375.1 hypothetical protein LEP1GSC045_2415 [Leptospira interrogans serovar Pomona str. Kennewicki LC82-25]EKN97637.1 hypothetical protein LEP1GSC014_3363 [Leptospira interrogans serovar Pomona str. Pomona]EKR35615.1 hypothetical protein LEP1GSC096_4042 [Leptospira interrogans serovar Hebdomadis str. R499]EMF31712.1 hypothetical protein LEP1GSC201_3422 [Leptospira
MKKLLIFFLMNSEESYNGRHTDSDTGEWFYSLNILNVCDTEEKNYNLFLREPDKIYKQLKMLY